jgi:hypothetical protein
MTKFKYIIILSITTLVIFIFLFQARIKNTWPFNTSFGYYVPNETKSLIYKILTPKSYSITSDKHNLEITSTSIPKYNFKKKYGGGIDNLSNEKVLYISVDGNFFIYDTKNKKLHKNEFKLNNYFNIRDIKVISELNSIAILGVTQNSNNCGHLELNLYKFDFQEKKLFLPDEESENIWKSEENCKFNPKTSGSRVEFKNNYFYISTGIFQSPLNSGIIIENWSQKNSSSFGKIIKIDYLKKTYEIFASGFRNPQGLFFVDNELFATDHGPKGGDEINLIKYKSNYGWPCISYGILYSKSVDDKNLYPNIEDIKDCEVDKNLYTEPLYAFSNSVALSQGLKYENNYFYNFENNILISSLKAKSLYRIILNINSDRILQLEKINLKKRIRDLIVTENGKIVFISDKGFVNIIE